MLAKLKSENTVFWQLSAIQTQTKIVWKNHKLGNLNMCICDNYNISEKNHSCIRTYGKNILSSIVLGKKAQDKQVAIKNNAD